MRAKRPLSVATLAFWLFCVSAAIYNLNYREYSEEDTIATRFVPLSLLWEGDLDLDEFEFLREGFTGTPHYLHEVRGHYISSSPILPALLAVPVYFVANQLGLLRRGGVDFFDDVTFTSKVAASMIAAASVAALFVALTRLTTRRRGVIVALLYAFATSTWSISSQGLWQHAPCELFLALMFLYLLDSEKEVRVMKWAGLMLALAFASRPAAAVLIPVFVLFSVHRHGRRASGFAVALVLGIACVLAYNLYYFGTVRGGYAQLVTHHVRLGKIDRPWTLSRVPSGLLGLLISPSRGVFIYSPILIFGLFGVPRRPTHTPAGLLLAYSGVAIAVWLIAGSAFFSWWAGWVYGPRYAVDVMPLWCMLLARSRSLFERRRGQVLAAVLAAYSLAVQAVGAFCYPAGWNWEPENVDLHPERLWNWRDTQILRCLRAGIHPNFFEEKATRHVEQGLRYWQKNQVRAALAEGRNAIRFDPNNAKAHRLLGNAYFSTGNYPAAERQYRQALNLDPRSPANLNNLGNLAVVRGNLDEAAKWYRRAIEQDEAFALAHFNLGVVSERKGDRRAAAAEYRRCLELAPHFARASAALRRLRAQQRTEDGR